MKKKLTFVECVRKRPGMYILLDMVGLIPELLINCIEICGTDKAMFKVSILGENQFSIKISADCQLASLVKSFSVEPKYSANNELPKNYLPSIFTIVTDSFELTPTGDKSLELLFSADNTFIDTDVDFFRLSGKLAHVAMLNRQCEILLIDKRQKYLLQNYHHYPQGVFYLLYRELAEISVRRKLFEIKIDCETSDRAYQIEVIYRSDWSPTPIVMSFVNNFHTERNGSLVDGVFDGLVDATRKYVKEKQLKGFRVERKRLMNGLMLACTVRGDDFVKADRLRLIDDSVRKEAKKLMMKSMLDFLRTDSKEVEKFLLRFDTGHLTYGMF